MKGRVKYVFILIMIVALGFIGYSKFAGDDKNEYIAKSEEKVVFSDKWNKIIAGDTNKKGIKLY